MAITDASSVYNETNCGPKKKNINPKNIEDNNASLLVSLIKISALSTLFFFIYLPTKVDAAIPKACPGAKDRLIILEAI